MVSLVKHPTLNITKSQTTKTKEPPLIHLARMARYAIAYYGDEAAARDNIGNQILGRGGAKNAQLGMAKF